MKTSNVAPSVALAVAEVESGFRSHVVSSAGAIGVMQIMPRTGRDVFGLSRDDLFEPKTNIRAGVTFLDRLIDRYEGRIDLALSHYNGGSRVTAGPQPKIIPATRGYVIKVLAAARVYRTQLAAAAEEAPADLAVHAAARSPSPAAATRASKRSRSPTPRHLFQERRSGINICGRPISGWRRLRPHEMPGPCPYREPMPEQVPRRRLLQDFRATGRPFVIG